MESSLNSYSFPESLGSSNLYIVVSSKVFPVAFMATGDQKLQSHTIIASLLPERQLTLVTILYVNICQIYIYEFLRPIC